MTAKTPSSSLRYEDFRKDFFRHHSVIPKNNIYCLSRPPLRAAWRIRTTLIAEVLLGAAAAAYAIGFVG